MAALPLSWVSCVTTAVADRAWGRGVGMFIALA
jgi:hypothetical protein